MSKDRSFERADDNSVNRVIAEISEQLRRGEQIDRADIISRHPSMAAELEDLFAGNDSRAVPRNSTQTQFLPEPDSGSNKSDSGSNKVVPAAEVETGRTGDDTPGDVPKSRIVMERLGRYQIVRSLGEGGMGTVYLARDTRLGRLVAVKIPHIPAVADPIHRARFLREAQSVAMLRHPNICPVFDAEEDGGIPYIAMAYIEGESLAARMARRKPFDPRSTVELILKITDALQHAHDQGIIHRDLKPANIMIDQRGEPIIMDFGLALQLNQSDDARVTRPGMVMGTPAYMAPEQIIGGVNDISAAADIYSLGVILFELLTGRTPFVGSAAEVMAQALKDNPPSATKLQARVDAELDLVCLRMLSKKASDRYSSMSSVADALKAYLRSKSGLNAAATSLLELPFFLEGSADETKAMPSADPVAVPVGSKKHRTRIAAIALIACTVVAAAAGMLMNRDGENVTVRIDDSVSSDLALLIDSKPWAFTKSEVRLTLPPGTHRWAVHRGEWVVRTDDFVVAERGDTDLTISLKEGPASETPAKPMAEIVRTHAAAGNLANFAVLPSGSTLIYATSGKIFSWDYVQGGDAKEIAFTDPEPIRALACDPSGKFLAVGLSSRIRVIEISSGKEIKSLPHQGTVTTSVAYASDGAYLAAAARGAKAVIWSVSADYKPAALPETARDGTALAFSPDNRILATAHRDGFVRLWDVKTNALERTLEPATKSTRSMAFSQDGSTLEIGDAEKLRRFNTANWTEQTPYSGHADDILSVRPHPGGGLVMTGSADKTLRFWDTKSGNEAERRQMDGSVSALAYSPNGQLLFDSVENKIHVWQLPVSSMLPNSTGLFATLTDHTGSVDTVAFSPDGRFLLSGSRTPEPAASDSDLRLWDVGSKQLVRTFVSKVDGLVKARFSSDGKIAAAVNHKSLFQFWDVATGERVHTFDGVGYGPIGIGTAKDFDFIPGRDQLVVVGSEGHSVIRLSDLKVVSHWKAHDERLKAVATFSDANTSWLLSGSTSGMIRAWSIPLVTESYSLKGHAAAVDALGVTPDGLWAISGSTGAYLLWNLNERQSLHKWEKRSPAGPNFDQGVAAVSSDGSRALLVTQHDPPLMVAIDVASGDPIQDFPGHAGGTVASVAISPDGRLAASGGADGKVKLWILPDKLNSERRAAEWVLSIAGRLSERKLMRTKGEISDPALLPADPLECVAITLDNNHQATDDGLRNVTGLQHLSILRLANTPITDAGLRNVKGLPMLDMLSLDGTAVTDAGLEVLRDFRSIRFLSLTKTKITGRGLSHLIALPHLKILYLVGTGTSDEYLPLLEGLAQLEDLYLDQTQVSDKGIEYLKRLEHLQRISLKGSKVTPAGIQELQKALPQLKILNLE